LIAPAGGRYVIRMHLLFALLCCLLAASGCGARSALRTSVDSELTCSALAHPTRPGVPVDLVVGVPGWALGHVQWRVESAPPGATPMLSTDGGRTARFSATTEGVYLVRVTIPTREDGDYPDGGADGGADERYSCVIGVLVQALGPEVTCPPDVTTAPRAMVSLTARVRGDRALRAQEWSLVDAPASSARPAPMPASDPTTGFRPDVAGDYRLRFVARDAAGAEGRCEVTVHAVPTEALRVEMFWNPPDRSCDRPGAPVPCDSSDVDLHLLRASRGNWVSPNDCYYANCTGSRGGLEWDAPGIQDNPRLDIDDTEGFGPENINIDRTGSASYRIGVHYFNGGSPPGGDAQVHVVVYCSSATPVARFGPVALRDRGSVDDNDFWLVADVVMSPTGCSVRPIQRDGREWIMPHREARTNPGPPPP
jgi:hypothetical protein